DICGHAHGHATIGRVDEQLGGAAFKVAAEDVATHEVAGVEGGPTADGDALGRARPRQDDDLGHDRRRRGGIASMSSLGSCLSINLAAMCPPPASICCPALSNPPTQMPASETPCMPSPPSL